MLKVVIKKSPHCRWTFCSLHHSFLLASWPQLAWCSCQAPKGLLVELKRWRLEMGRHCLEAQMRGLMLKVPLKSARHQTAVLLALLDLGKG